MDAVGAAEAGSTPPQPRLPRLVFYASLPAVLFALLPPCAAWWWMADVALHFSWVPAVALVPAVVLNWRHRLRLAVLLTACLIGWWPWWRGSTTSVAPKASDQVLSVASANLYDFNRHRAAALARIVALPVDVLGVQEVLPADHALLAQHWPFAVWTQERHLLASALLSRHPIIRSQVHDLEGFALIDARLQTPTGPLQVYVVHLASPKSPRQSALRSTQLERLGTLLRSHTEPVLLLGDLNLGTVSPHWQRFADLAEVQRPDHAPVGTWPAWIGRFGADIDHIAGRRLGIGTVTAFTIPGSDHRGVMTTISLR